MGGHLSPERGPTRKDARTRLNSRALASAEATTLLNLPPRTQDTEPQGLGDSKRNTESDTDAHIRSLETGPSFTRHQDHAQTLSGW